MLAGAVYEVLQPAVARGIEWAGEPVGITWTLGANGNMILQSLAMLAIGYFVKDRPNAPPPEDVV
jgi:hypothetical protein